MVTNTHKYIKMDNKTLAQKLVLANLEVIDLEVLPLIEKEFARIAAQEGLGRIKETVVALLDENPDNKAQVNFIWSSLATDPDIANAVRSALLEAVSSVDEQIVKDALTLLVSPITLTLAAVSDDVKPNGEQIKNIWLEFLKSDEFRNFVLANLEVIVKTIIKKESLEKLILSILKLFNKV